MFCQSYSTSEISHFVRLSNVGSLLAQLLLKLGHWQTEVGRTRIPTLTMAQMTSRLKCTVGIREYRWNGHDQWIYVDGSVAICPMDMVIPSYYSLTFLEIRLVNSFTPHRILKIVDWLFDPSGERGYCQCWLQGCRCRGEESIPKPQSVEIKWATISKPSQQCPIFDQLSEIYFEFTSGNWSIGSIELVLLFLPCE